VHAARLLIHSLAVTAALTLSIFFCSGAAGLLYEVLWTRQLSLVFGVTTYAISTVLATFMGGLALGSYVLGRVAGHHRRPLLLYALLETGIGVYALLVPMLLAALRPLYIGLAHLDLSYPVFSLGRALLAALVLLVPTTLMGGTYPVLVSHWVRERDDVARGAGVLYFVNTAGAIAGCVLAGFVLLERLGLSGTNRVAALLNVLLAAAVAVLAWRSAPRPATPGRSAPTEEATALRPALARLVLLCAGLSGFVSLAAEVLWSRALLRYLYNSTYAFTTMLATFLSGIALGSFFFTTFLARRHRPLVVFALLQGSVGIGLAVAVVPFPHLRGVYGLLFGTTTVTSFPRALVSMFVGAAVLLLPVAIFLGALFPLATALYARAHQRLGPAVGRVYAVNTLGAVLGSLGCAFVLIPTLGMSGTNRLLLALSFGAAGVVAVAAVTGTAARVAAGAVVATALVGSLAVTTDDVFRRTFVQAENQHLVFYKEGATDTVGVQEGFGQRAIIYEDQRGTAATSTYGTNFFLGHLPMLLHPGTPRRVLHICFGVGNSLSAVAAHTELERVDNVELSPHVLDAGPLFWTNDDVLEHPKVRTIIDDGRNFLMTTRETYDVILLEPPETFTAGVINLYTVEFYRAALARLAPNGLMMQWIPTANAPLDDERRLFRAFADVFPHVTMWWQLDGGTALLVGSRQPLRIDYQKLKARLAEPRVHQDMLLSRVRDVDHLLSFFTFDEATFADFVRDVPPTTDDWTVLDFSMPRYGGSGFGLGQWNQNVTEHGVNPFGFVFARYQEYRKLRRSVVPYLTNLGADTPAAVQERIAARTDLPSEEYWFRPDQWRRMRRDGRLPPDFAAASGGS